MSPSTFIHNVAAYLDEPNTPLRIGDAPTPTSLDPNEVLIKVHAVAINPADAMRQAMGAFNVSHPWIFGSDAAGVVEAVGSAVTGFKVGDRVTALSDEFTNHKTSNSAFQTYMAAGIRGVSKIPDSLSFTDAAVLPLGLSSVAGMLFEPETLNLRYPMPPAKLESFSSAGPPEVVTVWGGSSSLGANGIQMLRAAGYRTIGIASSRNFELMRNCGVDECFDYGDEDMVDKLVAFVRRKGWVSAGIAAAAGMIGDEAQVAKTTERCGELALKLGGKRFVSTCLARGFMPVPSMPDGVSASNCLGLSDDKAAEHIWGEWLPEALESGQLKCMPPAKIVGEGLESVNAAIELMKKGVSAQKLVVKIC